VSAAPGRIARPFEASSLLQRCPFGAVAAMTVQLVPRYRARPLELKVPAKGAPKPVVG
jgi:hypothetical protein